MSSNASHNTITLLQATLDENKESISDDLYLRMCNLNKKLMEETEEKKVAGDSKDMYRIAYTVFSLCESNLSSNCNFHIDTSRTMMYKPMWEHQYQNIKQDILENGGFTLNSDIFTQCGILDLQHTKHTVPYIDGDMVEDEQNEVYIEYIVSVPFKVSKTYMITNIEKVN